MVADSYFTKEERGHISSVDQEAMPEIIISMVVLNSGDRK
jgi:hypothetical protein